MLEKLAYLILAVLLLGLLAWALKWLLAILGVPHPINIILVIVAIVLVGLGAYRHFKP